MSRRFLFLSIVVLIVSLYGTALTKADAPKGVPAIGGTFPADARGRPLNLGFETGTLADWTAEGEAFRGQPIKGDVVHRRRGDMSSRHAGDYWVGSYDVGGDEPRGTLTSVPFVVTKPFASFLVGGGSQPGTRVELIRPEGGQVIFRAYGDEWSRTLPVELAGVPLRLVAFEDLVARHARLCWDLVEGKPVAPKFARDLERMVQALSPAGLEGVAMIWQEHRKPHMPASFEFVFERLRTAIRRRPELLVDPVYSTDVHALCGRCHAVAAFPLADAGEVKSILGYC